MKVGQIFTLPTDVTYYLGRIGKLKNDDQTKVLAKYEVVSLCSCGKPLTNQDNIGSHTIKGHKVEGELKGKVIVTYGNKRKSKA